MKGYRFYAEMPQDRKSASKANPFFPRTVKALRERAAQGFRCDVVAVPLDDKGRKLYQGATLHFDAICTGVGGNPYSYTWNGANRDYLAKRTTRIPEDLARILSPELFCYLES